MCLTHVNQSTVSLEISVFLSTAGDFKIYSAASCMVLFYICFNTFMRIDNLNAMNYSQPTRIEMIKLWFLVF